MWQDRTSGFFLFKHEIRDYREPERGFLELGVAIDCSICELSTRTPCLQTSCLPVEHYYRTDLQPRTYVHSIESKDLRSGPWSGNRHRSYSDIVPAQRAEIQSEIDIRSFDTAFAPCSPTPQLPHWHKIKTIASLFRILVEYGEDTCLTAGMTAAMYAARERILGSTYERRSSTEERNESSKIQLTINPWLLHVVTQYLLTANWDKSIRANVTA